MNDKRKTSKEGSQTQIIAPRPFMDCLYKECNMTYKGVVETRTKLGKTTETSEKSAEYFSLKFNGIIFPQPIGRICNLSKAILKHPKNEKYVDSVNVSLTSDTNSHPFSHKQLVKQIVVTRDDTF